MALHTCVCLTPLCPPPLAAGLRAVHADGHAGAAAGGQRDGPCVHLRHAEAAAHDHQRDGQGADPDLPQLPRLAPALRPHHRPAHERHGLRGDRPHLPGVRVGQQRGDQGKKTGDLAPRGCLLFGVFSSSGPAGWRQGAWPLVSGLPTGPARPPGRLSVLLSLPGRLHALALIDKNLILPPWPYKAWFPSPESLAGPLTFLISCSCLLLWCCFGRGQGEDVGNGNIWPDRAFLRPARRPYRRRPPRVPLLEGACPGSRKKVPGMGQPLRPQLLGVRV